MSQSTQDIEYGWNGDSTTLNSNFIRDILFGGDEKKYVVVSTLIGAVGVYTGFVYYPMLASTSAAALIPGRGTQGNASENRGLGANRAARYSDSWQSGSVKDAINKFAPDATPVYTDTGKIIFRNESTGIEVVYDIAGNYYRIIDTNLSGRRNALDINGNRVPNNVQSENGTQRGMTQGEYNAHTHFNNLDSDFGN